MGGAFVALQIGSVRVVVVHVICFGLSGNDWWDCWMKLRMRMDISEGGGPEKSQRQR